MMIVVIVVIVMLMMVIMAVSLLSHDKYIKKVDTGSIQTIGK